MKRLTTLITLLAALTFAERVHAELTLTLTPSAANAAPRAVVDFSGTLTNTSTTDKVFLNDVALTFAGSELVLQPNAFFANVPGILLPGETYNGLIFRVALSANATPGDYAASLLIKGGADILANGDLANAQLIVLSPSVSITATNANAGEAGPVNGWFTVSRTGGTGADLMVSYQTSGTTINGTGYSALSGFITIPAGSASATITLVPIANNLAEGDRTAVLTLAATSSYRVAAAAAATATVTVHDKPADNWRFVNFGAAANDPEAADGADWDKDGLTNLMEFALNLNPKVADSAAQPAPVIVNDYLTLTFVPNPAATDVTFVVEASTALSSWSTSDVEEITALQADGRTFRYKHPVSATGRAFLRLRVTR